MPIIRSDEVHPLDYDQVTPLLYVGTNACCWGHFDQELLSKGVRGDISLEDERLDQSAGIGFFLWLPTKDQAAPSRENVDLGVQTLMYCRDQRIVCYVHCKNGHGRAPTLVAAFLMRSEHLSANDAVARLKVIRPAIHLNTEQMALLESLA